jgi:hypothetical protein
MGYLLFKRTIIKRNRLHILITKTAGLFFILTFNFYLYIIRVMFINTFIPEDTENEFYDL